MRDKERAATRKAEVPRQGVLPQEQARHIPQTLPGGEAPSHRSSSPASPANSDYAVSDVKTGNDNALPSANGALTQPQGLDARWVPGQVPLVNGDPADATAWRKRLENSRVTNPVEPEGVLSEWAGLDIPDEFKAKVHRGMRSMLDLLPREMVETLGTFKMEVALKLESGGLAEYDHSTRTIRFAQKVLDTHSEMEVRALTWHEMAHWLYLSAGRHPRLQQWRKAIEEHWDQRVPPGDLLEDSGKGWQFHRDSWIDVYAGRVYPGLPNGQEIASIYLEAVAWGPEQIAEQLIIPKSQETFDIVTAILGKYTEYKP